jgi:hypothetical protein
MIFIKKPDKILAAGNNLLHIAQRRKSDGFIRIIIRVIGKGKTAKGLVLSEDSVSIADWYKVKLTSKRKLSFEIHGKSCDSILFEIIPASKNVILFGSTIRIYDAGGGVYTTEDSMPAGTYYIKVTKTSKTSSGYYTIKFK